MTDPAVEAAQSAALILAAELGPDLPTQVQAALYARQHGRERPGQYDPLAVTGLATGAASLIVAIAQLAWSIYSDRREHTSEPEPEFIIRQVRFRLRAQDTPVPAETGKISEVVVSEVIRLAKD